MIILVAYSVFLICSYSSFSLQETGLRTMQNVVISIDYLYSRELFIQVVQNILPPIPLNTPMVLIKPPEECSTVEVYKVCSLYF